jgi:hypothetical protein
MTEIYNDECAVPQHMQRARPASTMMTQRQLRGCKKMSPMQSLRTQDDMTIEESANQYFQQIYVSEDSAREVVEVLKSLKSSEKIRENNIFAWMIRDLFDEYRFISKYPEKELCITGTLFGLLIKEKLVSDIILGIALRDVLEALRKSPTQSPQSRKMFRFGMFALEQFKERLHEWPQYCSHIVQIPHLRDGFPQLVAEIDGAMSSVNNISTSSSISTSELATGRDIGVLLGLGDVEINQEGSQQETATGTQRNTVSANSDADAMVEYGRTPYDNHLVKNSNAGCPICLQNFNGELLGHTLLFYPVVNTLCLPIAHTP